MHVLVNGLMANYRKSGTGKRILVFLHGWGDTNATFNEVINILKEEFMIISIDLPGFGGSQAPISAWSLSDYADFTNDLLAKIDVQKVNAFVGHSYGGAVLIKGLGQNKLQSEKLVLIGSAGIRASAKLQKQTLKIVSKAAKLPLYLLPKNRRNAIKTKAYSKLGSDYMLAPHMQAIFKKIINDDVRKEATSVSAPTLLIYGSKDSETPVEYGQLLAQAIPKSELRIVEGAGHFVHQSNQDEVAKYIKDFLGK